MAQKTNQDALEGLDKLIAETRARLEANPDFVALNALQKARAEMVGVKGAAPTPVRTVTVDFRGTPSSGKRISQLAAAETALDKVGHPLPVDALMDKAVEEGAVVGGDKPVISFGSSLSKSEKFKSVRWNGEYAWWFSDRPLPEPIQRIRIRQTREAAE